MIRRDAGNDWLLIAQAHHAHLAGQIARQWGNQRVPGLPLREELVAAVHDHDEGWYGWEQAPEVDHETARPRDFTEMSMAAATEIWTRSIEAAARGAPLQSEALRRYQQHLSAWGERLTGNRAAILEAVLAFRSTFLLEDLVDALAMTVSRAAVLRAVTELQLAGVIRFRESPVGGGYYEVAVPPIGPSPLAGIWVSRHFTWLAEQARESRRDNAADLTAVETFLRQQAQQQQEWTGRVREFAGDELKRVVETGFRYVQFFDRLSLWLCCAERREPLEIQLPGGTGFELVPREATTVSVKPFPLAERELVLRVPCRRIPAGEYPNQSDLSAALETAPLEELAWTLKP